MKNAVIFTFSTRSIQQHNTTPHNVLHRTSYLILKQQNNVSNHPSVGSFDLSYIGLLIVVVVANRHTKVEDNEYCESGVRLSVSV